VDGTFKNAGNYTLNLSIIENFNGETKAWTGLRSILPNETLSYGQLFGKPTFEINSSGIDQDLKLFKFTYSMEVVGLGTSLSYSNNTTLKLPINPIFRMKQANGGIILLSDNSPGTTITYTLEMNSTVNMTDVSIYDAFYPSKYYNISNIEAGKPQSTKYTYQATISDLSSLRCEESKYGDYPCIINLATMTGKINGTAFTDTDYVELFVCKLNDANCVKGYISYREPKRASSISSNPGSGSISTSSGGGGGGGGGVPPSEDFNNIERREIREMGVQAKTVAAYVFKSADPVMAVSFESSVSENGVPVAVEVLRNRSKRVNENAPGQLYKYFNIFVGTSGFSTKVSKGVVVFRVNNSWLEENRIDPGNVRLYKWDGIAWIEKTTQLAERKTNQTYYASMVGNYSSFAIAGKISGTNSTSGQYIDLSNRTNESDVNTTNVENNNAKPVQNFNIILTILPIIGLLGMMYYLRIKRKIKNKMVKP